MAENGKPVQFGQALFRVNKASPEAQSPERSGQSSASCLKKSSSPIAAKSPSAIIRACKELDIRPWPSIPRPTWNSMHVQLADEAICIGTAPSSRKLSARSTASSALRRSPDVDAIHPGYGFLSENAPFRRSLRELQHQVHRAQPASAIRSMGDKNAARDVRSPKAGVPISPGSDGIGRDRGRSAQGRRKDRLSR